MNVRRFLGIALSAALTLGVSSCAFAYDANDIKTWDELNEAIVAGEKNITITQDLSVPGTTTTGMITIGTDTKISGTSRKISGTAPFFNITAGPTEFSGITFEPTNSEVVISTNADTTIKYPSSALTVNGASKFIEVAGGTTTIEATTLTISSTNAAFKVTNGKLAINAPSITASGSEPFSVTGGELDLSAVTTFGTTGSSGNAAINLTGGTLTVSNATFTSSRSNTFGSGRGSLIYQTGGTINSTNVIYTIASGSTGIYLSGGTGNKFTLGKVTGSHQNSAIVVACDTTFENVEFTANDADPVIDVVASGVAIFTAATPPTGTTTNNAFTNNNGTAVRVAGTATFTNAYISGNKGANAILNNAQTTITSALVTGNTANTESVVASTGGMLKIENSTFSSNGADDHSKPTNGVVYVTGGTLDMPLPGSGSGNGSDFTGNKVRALKLANNANATLNTVTFSQNSGAIDISGNAQLSLANMTFDRNDASAINDDGGAIKISGPSAVVTFPDDTAKKFTGNTARRGGAIYTEQSFPAAGTEGTATGFTFTDNHAVGTGADQGHGGAIYSGGAVTLHTAGWSFTSVTTGNTADQNGGAIYAVGNVSLNGPTFTSNKAGHGTDGKKTTDATTGSGGAVYSESTELDAVVVDGDTTFTSNHAKTDGGAIYTKGRIRIASAQTKFNTNKALDGSGGAINSENSSYSQTNGQGNAVYVSNGEFLGNEAFTRGGAICAPNGGVYVSGGTFGSQPGPNRATKTGDTDGGQGGAIWGKGVTAKGTQAAPVIFSYNEAYLHGGAIYSITNLAYVDYSRFDHNQARYGGALLSEGEIRAVRSDFHSNNANAQSGGAIHNAVDANNVKNVMIVDCTFVSNTATNSGGAIYFTTTSNSVTQNVLRCYFKSNTAAIGGAINMPGGTTQTSSIVRSYFHSNTATGLSGGAVFIAGSKFDLVQSAFVGNSVIGGNDKPTPPQAPSYPTGGALYCSSQTYKISNTTFYGNRAANSGFGGAIYLASAAGAAGSGSAIMYCTIANNEATNGNGGGIATNAQSANFQGNIIVGNTSSIGRDVYRIDNALTTRGYNFVENYGTGTSGGQSIGDVDWRTESGVVGTNGNEQKTLDVWNDTRTTFDAMFGNATTPAANTDPSKSVYGYTIGSPFDGLDASIGRQIVPTLKLLQKEDGTSSPAIGFMPGNTARNSFQYFFNVDPINDQEFAVRYEHQDARAVNRAVTTPAPAGGLNCDAGAYQTVDASGSNEGLGVQRVEISGVPNFMMRVGQTVSLTSAVFVNRKDPANPNKIITTIDYSQPVSWNSTDPYVATVDNYGNVIAVGTGTTTITVATRNVGSDGRIRTDSASIEVRYASSSTNIADEYVRGVFSGYNSSANSGASVGIADYEKSELTRDAFSNAFYQSFGVHPTLIEALTSASNISLKNASTGSSPLKSPVAIDLDTLLSAGAFLPLKYTFTIEWATITSMLGRNVTTLSENDINTLFSIMSLSFRDEGGRTITLVDDGSKGVQFARARSTRAIIPSFTDGSHLTLMVNLLLADAAPRSSGGGIAATADASINMIDGKLVVGDGLSNGRISGAVWLNRDIGGSGSGNGGGGGYPGGGGGGGEGGGGGGGCSAGASLAALGALALLARRRGKKND